MCFALAGTQHYDCKGSLVVFCHGTVVPGDRIQFSAPSWFAAITNGSGSSAGSKNLRLENVVIMEIEVLI
jgi:hypothetical protein